MIIEISVGVIAGAFTALVVFLIITLCKTNKTLRETNTTLMKAQMDLDDLSHESILLMRNVNELISDIKEKSNSLNVLFKPLAMMGNEYREKQLEEQRKLQCENVTSVMECLASGIILFNKLKEGFKKNVNR